ncbi:response regulator [Paraflavisolibacter sp. H34]|uniref:response regulator n=1 Tax=Huijunlia imazamoxiresistens TaxID=3127457 RepID=UPI0030175D4F
MKKEKRLHILLVDDDAVDRELFIDALNPSEKNCLVSEAADGQEALDFLGAQSLPDLIILDLNMPVKDGRQTLKELKAHPVYKTIPVCILSTSSAQFDVLNAYDSGANLFLVKPHDYRELTEMLQNLLTLFGKYTALAAPASHNAL